MSIFWSDPFEVKLIAHLKNSKAYYLLFTNSKDEGGFKAGAVGQGGKHRTLPGVCHGWQEYQGWRATRSIPGVLWYIRGTRTIRSMSEVWGVGHPSYASYCHQTISLLSCDFKMNVDLQRCWDNIWCSNNISCNCLWMAVMIFDSWGQVKTLPLLLKGWNQLEPKVFCGVLQPRASTTRVFVATCTLLQPHFLPNK